MLEFTDGDATRLFLDASTHMPLMITWQGPALRFAQGRRGGRGQGADAAQGTPDQTGATPSRVQGAPATMAMHFSDYRTVNGIKLPFTVTRSLNDQTLEEMTVKHFKVNLSFKGNTFTKPKP